jgi:hypothetical protein
VQHDDAAVGLGHGRLRPRVVGRQPRQRPQDELERRPRDKLLPEDVVGAGRLRARRMGLRKESTSGLLAERRSIQNLH